MYNVHPSKIVNLFNLNRPDSETDPLDSGNNPLDSEINPLDSPTDPLDREISRYIAWRSEMILYIVDLFDYPFLSVKMHMILKSL